MGRYLNPGNIGFEKIINGTYVDKTGLIGLMNKRVNSMDGLVFVSRPRRFGKSYAAKMLTAYYDCSCDSSNLFAGRQTEKTEGFDKYLNKFNVISIDITSFLSVAVRKEIPLAEVPNMIEKALIEDVLAEYSMFENVDSLTDLLLRIVDLPDGKQFVFVIDEWDALIRESVNDSEAKTRYLSLLREWFKNSSFTPRVVAAAYMTGILPIKKDGSQSAISDFSEYTVINPGEFAEYTGFTEDEVKHLCAQSSVEFSDVKIWYDGYEISGEKEIYNPYSVMSAVREGKCRSYWKKTSAAESLMTYINMDFEGLQDVIARFIAGEEIEVHVDTFQNDFETFNSKDDVLTLLIHLGYLTYNDEEKTARIPNEEVKEEFRQILRGTVGNKAWIEMLQRSQKLIEDTYSCRGEAVAAALDEIRKEQYAPQFYNNEQALRAVIKYGYIAAFGTYLKVEELPSGKGIADVVFIPSSRINKPALIVELKWNKTAGGAIEQIKDQSYPKVLEGFDGEILLVGINYDEKTKIHTCKIEKLDR